ncbi:MAG: hypothetical protein K1000chlam2_00442 [Chlamydiae bacterium]|nr:hypothetical protein [Chlamydiota bacterium]
MAIDPTNLSTFLISDLPTEILFHVLSQVEPKDYPNLALTCKAFHCLIANGLPGENYHKFLANQVASLYEKETREYTLEVHGISDEENQEVFNQVSQLDAVKELVKEYRNKSSIYIQDALTSKDLNFLWKNLSEEIDLKADYTERSEQEILDKLSNDQKIEKKITNLRCQLFLATHWVKFESTLEDENVQRTIKDAVFKIAKREHRAFDEIEIPSFMTSSKVVHHMPLKLFSEDPLIQSFEGKKNDANCLPRRKFVILAILIAVLGVATFYSRQQPEL